MNSFNIPSRRHNELAILNGMEVNQQISQGTSLKIVK